MAFQEGRMGTSGEYFLLPPYGWTFQASSPAHPIMSRFNLIQALDSGLQQQFLIIQEMSPDFYSNQIILNGRTIKSLEKKAVWKGLQFTDPSIQPPEVELMQRGIELFARKWTSTDSPINGTEMGLYTQYDFWIRCAVRWLFYKYQITVQSVSWSAAVERYNGSGAKAEAYRNDVFKRIRSANNQSILVGDE